MKLLNITFLFLIYSILISSCEEENKKAIIKNELNKINIGKNNSSYINIQNNKNEFLTDLFVNNLWKSRVSYDNSGKFKLISNINEFNQLEEYYFKNNTLNCLYRYNSLENGTNQLQDIINFKNGYIDELNSCYLETNILNISENNIEVEIKFKSGLIFIDGELCYGNYIYSSKQAKELKRISFNKNPFIVTLKKKDVVYKNNYLEFAVLITRDARSKIKNFTTKMTDKKIKTFTHFFIVKQKIDLKM
jgi:hypothetical protein